MWLLLQAATTMSHSTFVHTRVIPCGLLQCGICWSAEDYECFHMCCQLQQEIRPSFVTTHAFIGWTFLNELSIQALYRYIPMPVQPSSMVPHGPLHTSFWRFLPLSTFCQQSPRFHLTLSAQYLRPLGLFYCRPWLSETLCPKTCGVSILQLIVSGNHWRQVIVYFSWINSSVRNVAANFSDYCGTSKHSPIAVVWIQTNSLTQLRIIQPQMSTMVYHTMVNHGTTMVYHGMAYHGTRYTMV